MKKRAAHACLLFVASVLYPVCEASGQTVGSSLLRKPAIEDLFQFENLTAEMLAPDGKSTLFMIQHTDLSEDRKYVNLWIADGAGVTRRNIKGRPLWSKF
jgi:hypothetical protein